MRTSFRFIAALALLLVAGRAAADVTLIEKGKAKCAVVAAPELMAADKPLPGLKFPQAEAERQRQRLRESARDLALYLGKMSGAKVEVVAKAPKDLVPVYVGSAATAVFGQPGKKAPYKQGFRYVVSNKGVGLLGESDLAASYAVYELLDRLGCRWYLPGELGEVVPRRETVMLKDVDFSSAPGTTYRGIWYADEAYKRRNRLGGLLLQAGHALEMYVTKEERQKHPEWKAEIGGKPHDHRLKWSSKTLAEALGDKVLAMHAKDPQPSYSLSPDDGSNWCESKEDRAIDADDFDSSFGEKAITDRLMVLVNRVAARVAAKEPDVLLGFLAYAQYTRPPVREKVHPNLVPQIAPITYSRAHPMTDDKVPDNKSLRYLIEGWGKKAKATSVYFYGYNLAETSAPNPMITKWGVDVPIVLKNNCKFWQPETLPNFESCMHALYLGSRLAWDPSLKPDDVIDDLHQKFYGSAAKEMAAYWKHIDDTWVKTPEYSGCGFGYLRRFTPEKMKQARKLMDAGKAAAKTDAEKKRVELADDSLKLFELFMKLRGDQAEGRFAGLADDAAKWRKMVTALGNKWKDNHCFTKLAWAEPDTVSGRYFAQFYQHTYDDAAKIAKSHTILTTKPIREFKYQADSDRSGEKKGFARADFDDKGWKTTDVALETWSTIGYHGHFKSMWYRTAVDVPAVPKGKKVYLWLGSTDGTSKVFVNGKHVPYVDPKGKASDEANGYCQPFSFDITAALKPGAKNTVAVLCTRTFFNELGTGGLLAPVVVYREKD